MLTWIISGWIHLAIGIVAGWVIFKRPAWAQRLIDRARDWIARHLGF